MTWPRPGKCCPVALRFMLDALGPSHWWPAATPFEVAVGAVLTQNTNWGNVERAIVNLKAGGDFEVRALAALPDEVLAERIRPAGYFRLKARRLKNLLAMEVLQAKGLFFLDSVTSAKSVASEAARSAGVPLYRRAVFLDNVRNVRTILGQLKLAERLALKRGRAIAIGHPYGETLEALRAWDKERDPHVKLVTLTDLGPEP